MKQFIVGLYLLLVSIPSIAQGTRKIQLAKGDYIMMWSCGGMARPRHNSIRVLTAGQFAEDTTHPRCYMPHGIAELTLNPMPPGRYDKAKVVLDSIPVELLDKGTSGCGLGRPMPDAVTTHIRARIDGRDYLWGFRNPLRECDVEIRNFFSLLLTKF